MCKIKQILIIILYFVCIVGLLKVSITAQTKGVKTRRKASFSSAYTRLNGQNSCQPVNMQKDDIAYICNGYKEYKIFVTKDLTYVFMYIGKEISPDNDKWKDALPIFLPNQYEWKGQIIEWRLANGKPFACIVRTIINKEMLEQNGGTDTLVVKNLKGFAPINIYIDISKNKNANALARQKADQGYKKLN